MIRARIALPIQVRRKTIVQVSTMAAPEAMLT
jgi:hypothetical protein